MITSIIVIALDLESIVRTAATSLGMLDANGQLKRLDSLGAIDLVVEIESAANVEIPAAALRQEAFVSVETIAQMVRTIARPL